MTTAEAPIKVETRGRKPLAEKKKSFQSNVRWSEREYSDLVEAAGGDKEKIPEIIRLSVKDIIQAPIRVKLQGHTLYVTKAEARQLIKELMEVVY